MKTFEYSFLSKFIYRYGNIPITIVLLFYLIGAALSLNQHLIYLIPLAITLVLLIILNRQYIKMYKFMPYRISVDNEQMICEDFMFSRKKVSIKFKEIDKLKGGIFDGRISGMHYLHDGKNDVTIGFFDKIKNAGALQTHILHLVNKDIYEGVVEKLNARKQRMSKTVQAAVQKKDAKKKKKESRKNQS